jgi:ribonuclease P protein component
MVKNKFHSFGIGLRIKKEKEIENLLSKGQRVRIYPLQIVYLLNEIEKAEDTSSLKLFVYVSKRNFKKAVDRNTLKRCMRESFRIAVPELKQRIPEGKMLYLGLTVLGGEIPTFRTTSKALIRFIEKHII